MTFKQTAKGGLSALVRASKYVGRGYWAHKDIIDRSLSMSAVALTATAIGGSQSDLSYPHTFAIGALGGGLILGAEYVAHKCSSYTRTMAQRIAAVGATYALPFMGATIGGAMLAADSTAASEFAQYIVDAGVVVLGGYAVLGGVAALGNFLHNLNEPTPQMQKQLKLKNPDRRAFLKTTSTLLTGIALSGFGYQLQKALQKKPFFDVEGAPAPMYQEYSDKEALRIQPLANDTYQQIAMDLTGSATNAHAIEQLNGPLGDKRIFIPKELLKPEYRNLEKESVIEFLSADKPSLWFIANDYAVAPSLSSYPVRNATRDHALRIIQRISLIPDETKIGDDVSVIIPTSLIYQGRLSSETIDQKFREAVEEEAPSLAPPPVMGGFVIDRRYFNKNATTPRKRFLGWRRGKRVYESQTRDIDMIVIHTTQSPAGSSESGAVDHIRRNRLANFVIGREGTVYMTVDPRFTANHAGESMWDGQKGVSYNSIGIEIVAKTEGKKQQHITAEQYAALRALKDQLQRQYPLIVDNRILGHNQVAFSQTYKTRGRKGDPGPDFRWDKLGLPNNYAIEDPDILERRIGWNPNAVRAGRVTQGQREAYERVNGR